MKNSLFYLFITIQSIALSQNPHSAVIKVLTPGQVVTPVTKESRDSARHSEKNCGKWDVSLLIRGVFLLEDEIYIHNHFTIEIGAGLCYRDFIFEITKSNSITNTTSQNTMPDIGNSVYLNYGSPHVGFCGEGGVKYYLKDFDNFEGTYLEAALSYRNYTFPNANNTLTANYYALSGTTVPGYSFIDYQFKFGYQVKPWGDEIALDLYLGIGLRNATLKYYSEEEITIPNSYSGNTEPIYTPTTQKSSFPQLLLGIKIGLAR